MLDPQRGPQNRAGWFVVMLICHCHQINDRTIASCALEGARTVAQVGRRCGAGTSCGGCVGAVREILVATHRTLPMVPRLLCAEPSAAAPVWAESAG